MKPASLKQSGLALTLLLSDVSLKAGSPWAVLWSGPAIIAGSVLIAWGAEAAQFFLAQGIALAVLACLQTLPEFAVEAVLAWRQEVPYLLANLTGALKLLTGLGWPMIYVAAATAYRRTHKTPMREIQLENEQSVQIVGLLLALVWQVAIWIKGSLTVFDAVILLLVYAGYLWIMRRLPPQDQESVEEIAALPRAIVRAPRAVRNLSILALFAVGGGIVFLVADPFLSALFGLSTALGVPTFVFIAWVAPMISESPEGISAFYWARDHGRASIALMNLVSSNINQWTLLAAMLPVVLSFSTRQVTAIPLDSLQSRELIMTIGQSLLGALFLLNMKITWYESLALFGLWLLQFVFSIGDAGARIHTWITWAYFVWCAVETVRLMTGRRQPHALRHFAALMKAPG